MRLIDAQMLNPWVAEGTLALDELTFHPSSCADTASIVGVVEAVEEAVEEDIYGLASSRVASVVVDHTAKSRDRAVEEHSSLRDWWVVRVIHNPHSTDETAACFLLRICQRAAGRVSRDHA